MTLILVALGAFLLGAGAVGASARYFLLLGMEMARDDRALDPGPVVGVLPTRPVGETSGRHHKPQASDGPAPDGEWPVADVDRVERLASAVTP